MSNYKITNIAKSDCLNFKIMDKIIIIESNFLNVRIIDILHEGSWSDKLTVLKRVEDE